MGASCESPSEPGALQHRAQSRQHAADGRVPRWGKLVLLQFLGYFYLRHQLWVTTGQFR